MTVHAVMPGSEPPANKRYTVEDIRVRPFLICHVPADQQTPDMCLAAVKEAGTLLKHVKQQTPEICLAAVQRTPSALSLVQQQTPETIWPPCRSTVWRSGL